MAAYQYRALDLDGRELQGVIEAGTSRHARSLLREQGLIPYAVDAAAGRDDDTRRDDVTPLCIARRTLAPLTRQWAALVDAGIPLERALAALIEQHPGHDIGTVLAAVRIDLLAGHPLHRALARHPRAFDARYCAVIAAGERSGQLGTVMNRLADGLEHAEALRQKTVQALVYPALIVLVAGAVVLALMTYVVPQVVAVFQSSRQTLPLLTRGLIAISGALRAGWPFAVLALVLGSWGAQRAWREERVRHAVHRLLMRVPLLGRLLVALDGARFAQTLAVLVASGVPLLASLAAVREVVALRPLRASLDDAARRVSEGQTLHRALAASGPFPPLLVHMVASGETSGRLDDLLDRAAAQLTAEAHNRLALALAALEPLLILAMGATVLLIVLAVLQPIVDINQMLR